jgi:hypothetical protein
MANNAKIKNIDNCQVITKMERSQDGNKLTIIARDSPVICQKKFISEKQDDDFVMTVDEEHINKLEEKGKIDSNIKKTLVNLFNTRAPQINSPADYLQLIKQLEEEAFSIRRLLEQSLPDKDDNAKNELYNVNSNEYGISRLITDRLYSLFNKIYKDSINMEKPKNELGTYKIIVPLEDSSNRKKQYGIEYTFEASSEANAWDIVNLWSDSMKTNALKTLHAYWAYAKKRGNLKFESYLSEIIKVTSKKDRTSHISSEEKDKFWQSTMLLERTKLTITVGKTVKAFPLLQILKRTMGGKIDNKIEEKFPLSIEVNVLDVDTIESTFNIKPYIPSGFCDPIPELPQNMVLLITLLEIRRNQRRNHKESEWDEGWIISSTHLEKTFASNPSVARKRVKEILNGYQELGIIKGFEIYGNKYKKYRIYYREQPKTTK